MRLTPPSPIAETEIPRPATFADESATPYCRTASPTKPARIWPKSGLVGAWDRRSRRAAIRWSGGLPLGIERDAFTPETGYPDPIMVDGVRLWDRVWFDFDLVHSPATLS